MAVLPTDKPRDRVEPGGKNMATEPRRWRSLLVGSAVLALALSGCSSSSTASSSAAPAAATTAASPAGPASSAASGSGVQIKDFAFNPASLTVPVGSAATWTNQDTAGHTVTADDGSFDSKTLP